ncbi:alpha,alpha-trehalose-phosphate synthase (UDP-forming) [Brevibacterium limosum]|uniref:alpha,alpha-trehalose-phosphate synthase (UDP-forming) n=1 Tax=Brevibacterium limosum TaxID=2697565 RepID=UPI0014220289|nr:trehalose-6-phosphate synthase [Brevibacterium limosum]
MPRRRDGHSFILMANRLPVDRCGDSWHTAPGGLVSALAPIAKAESGAWIGWPGTCEETIEPFGVGGMHLVPIPLSCAEHRQYYEGFSNAVLWPLYHDLIVAPEYRRDWWFAYEAVNARFARAAIETAAYGATIWIHDYHLQLVPRMIRGQRPDVRIGFFNHIPFPPVELLAQLPWREAVMDGLLGADVIGLQRESDVTNFRAASQRFLGIDPDRVSNVIGAYPISVDVDAIREAAESESVARLARQFRHDLGNPEVLMLGIDRLDYTKGIPQRLHAVEELLDEGALDPETTVLAQVAVPSREGIGAYQDLRDEVERLIGRVNGRFGTIERGVVQYAHQSYSFEATIALYLAADVLLVTSLRDGMNLVAKEFVTARQGSGGALVLSEFAGAADELDRAIIVNPHDTSGLKNGIRQAASLTGDDAPEQMAAMAAAVKDNDLHQWARRFLNDLQSPMNSGLPLLKMPTRKTTGNLREVKHVGR